MNSIYTIILYNPLCRTSRVVSHCLLQNIIDIQVKINIFFFSYDFTPWQIRDSNPIQYLCLVCGYHFVSKSQGEMQVHWQERHEKFVLKRKCTICGRTTSTSTKAFVDHLIQVCYLLHKTNLLLNRTSKFI